VLVGVFLFVCSYIGLTHLNHKIKVANQAAGNAGFAVVELFTSEGCSSCPPADEAVAQLINTGQKNVYVLGFHVDYWNSLGWKDAYSSALYSQRQQEYANFFKLNSIYTPEAIVNGKTEFTGSDTRRLHDAVDESVSLPPAGSVEISAKNIAGTMVSVSYKLAAPLGSGLLNVALVQLHAQSKVQRGENSGRLLNHVNVVRDFKTVSAKEALGSVTLQIPAGLAVGDCRIIAYTQDAGWAITSAAEADIK
jgi:hypothetical protein